MHQADVENHLLDGKLKSLRRENERHVNEKRKCENEMLALLQDQVTNEQANKQRGRNIQNMQDKRRNMELMMNNTEAQLSEILFELEKLKGVISRSRNYAQDLAVSRNTVFFSVIYISALIFLVLYFRMRKVYWKGRPKIMTMI